MLPCLLPVSFPQARHTQMFGQRLPEMYGEWPISFFDGKLDFTRGYMQGNFIPKNLKLPEPKPAPKPRAKASSKASSRSMRPNNSSSRAREWGV